MIKLFLSHWWGKPMLLLAFIVDSFLLYYLSWARLLTSFLDVKHIIFSKCICSWINDILWSCNCWVCLELSWKKSQHWCVPQVGCCDFVSFIVVLGYWCHFPCHNKGEQPLATAGSSCSSTWLSCAVILSRHRKNKEEIIGVQHMHSVCQ